MSYFFIFFVSVYFQIKAKWECYEHKKANNEIGSTYCLLKQVWHSCWRNPLFSRMFRKSSKLIIHYNNAAEPDPLPMRTLFFCSSQLFFVHRQFAHKQIKLQLFVERTWCRSEEPQLKKRNIEKLLSHCVLLVCLLCEYSALPWPHPFFKIIPMCKTTTQEVHHVFCFFPQNVLSVFIFIYI